MQCEPPLSATLQLGAGSVQRHMPNAANSERGGLFWSSICVQPPRGIYRRKEDMFGMEKTSICLAQRKFMTWDVKAILREGFGIRRLRF